jgi:hypothetical protein
MKEHTLFMELDLTPRDKALGAEAANMRAAFDKLLSEAIDLANENVSQKTLESRQLVSQYTLEAERLTNFYTSVPIDMKLTERELRLIPAVMPQSGTGFDTALVQRVESLNTRAYQLTAALADVKAKVLNDVLTCKMFTSAYPLLLDHILREARFFMQMLTLLMQGETIHGREDIITQEIFWNRIMAEHSKFIAGLLDPTEEALIEKARAFGKEFDMLTAESVQAQNQAQNQGTVTAESLQHTMQLRDFKATGTKGLIDCKLKSIIIPLLADHTLREANHYLCVLGSCRG